MRSSHLALALVLAGCGSDPAPIVDAATDTAAADAAATDAAATDAAANNDAATTDTPPAIDAAAAIDADVTPVTYFGNSAADQFAGGVFPTSGSDALLAHDALVARLTTHAIETFTDIAVGDLSATGSTASTAVLAGWGAGTSTVTQDLTGLTAGLPAAVFDASANGRFNTTPGSDGVVGDGRWLEASSAYTVTLAAPAHGFGIYVTDVGDFGSTLHVDLFLGAAPAGAVDVPPIEALDGNLAFFGRVDPTHPFDRVVISIVQTSTDTSSWDRIGFDDLVVGTID